MECSNLTSKKSEKKYLYFWIDILGFRNSIKIGDKGKYEESIELVKNFRNSFSKTGHEFSIPISDGIVLIFDIKRNIKRNIEEIFKKIAEIQNKFIKNNGEFLRGGFALGTISDKYYSDKYYRDNKETVFLVSNGLINAYEIESNFINYPIIGTNMQTIKELNKIIYNMEEIEKHFNLIKINSRNGGFAYAIDFLNEIKEENERNDFIKLVCNKITEFGDDEKILNKYLWLLRYYESKFNKKGDMCNKYLKGVLL